MIEAKAKPGVSGQNRMLARLSKCGGITDVELGLHWDSAALAGEVSRHELGAVAMAAGFELQPSASGSLIASRPHWIGAPFCGIVVRNCRVVRCRSSQLLRHYRDGQLDCRRQDSCGED
jgi:hypothetical protein